MNIRCIGLMCVLIPLHLYSMEVNIDLDLAYNTIDQKKDDSEKVAHSVINAIYGDNADFADPRLIRILQEAHSNNPDLFVLRAIKRSEKSIEEDLRDPAFIISNVLVQAAEDKYAAEQKAQQQKDKVVEKKNQLRLERAKKFYSILVAVGSTALAAASTAWGAVSTTTAGQAAVYVMCNCTI